MRYFKSHCLHDNSAYIQLSIDLFSEFASPYFEGNDIK